jgi:hypothetical protein
MLILGGRFGIIRDNVFSRRDKERPLPINHNASCGVTISSNTVWYYPNWPATATVACPSR